MTVAADEQGHIIRDRRRIRIKRMARQGQAIHYRRKGAAGYARSTQLGLDIEVRRQQPFLRHGLQAAHITGLKAQFADQQFCGARAVLRSARANARTALDDGFVKQTLGCRHRHHCRYLGATAGLTKDSDVGRIATEGGDVSLDPLQHLHHIEDADIARAGKGLAADAGQMRKAEHVEAMIDAHEHDVAATREIGTVI